MNVISVSRRTDIPAFYGKWFMKRIEQGEVEYTNPFGGQVYRISLKQEDVICFLFWSKNFQPFLPFMKKLKALNYRFYCHFTITDHPDILEKRMPSLKSRIAAFRSIAESYGPEFTCWRFDPINFWDEYRESYYLEKFDELSEMLEGYTFRCYFSFAAWYGKVQRNLAIAEKQNGITFEQPAQENKISLLQKMSQIATNRRITLYSCCDDTLVEAVREVQKAHCLDRDIVKKLRPDLNAGIPSRPTRKQCGCYASRDIGAYDTCPGGCIYCYANMNLDAAEKRFKNHDPEQINLLQPLQNE